MSKKKYCIATVTSESFFIGTMVMIHSFLKYNRWFKKDGEIVIIHDDLPIHYKEMTTVFSNVVFLQVSDELKKHVDFLAKEVPSLKLEDRKKRFYSLEVFRLENYQKTLFTDSDVLFQDDVSNLFGLGSDSIDEKEKLVVGGDNSYFKKEIIDPETFLPIPNPSQGIPSSKGIKNIFAAGLFVADKQLVTQQNYQGLLALLNVERWKKIHETRTVHVILNLYFNDKCRHISSTYNYPIMHTDLIDETEKIPFKEIKVLHFNGIAKPWECLKILSDIETFPKLAQYLGLWHKEYLEMLPKYHILKRFK